MRERIFPHDDVAGTLAVKDYSLSLALFDYIPVALSAIGLFMLAGLLARISPASRPWLLGAAALVTAGGLSKAGWKLSWVLTGADHAWADNLLFVLVAPGMILLGWHTAGARRVWRDIRPGSPTRNAAIAIALLYAAALSAEGRAWFFILLAGAALANVLMSGILIGWAWELDDRPSAGIFLFSILVVLSLGGLARVSAGSAPLQWLAECLNALAQGSFALAVWRLRRTIAPAAGPAYGKRTEVFDT